MKRKMVLLFVGLVSLGFIPLAQAVVIDFNGGIATLRDGSTVSVTDTDLFQDSVDYYIEDGIMIDFIGGYGTIGDYYSIGSEGTVYENSVIHSHWHGLDSIVFSKVDGSTMDLNYMDLSSNTESGGGQATGNERSYITSSEGHEMHLPSSDWGLDYDFFGDPGDGISRLWMDDNFDNITYFTVTSENAYCFGLDNFYIDEPAPPIEPVPEPGTMALLGLGVLGMVGMRKKLHKK